MADVVTKSSDPVFTPMPSRPAPVGQRGVIHWFKTRLFYSPASTIFTLVTLYLLYSIAAPFYDWAVTNAVWEASTRRECFDKNMNGACWAGVIHWFDSYLYGRFPVSERWRANLGGILLILWALPIWLPRVSNKATVLTTMVVVYPFLAVFLFLGGDWPLVPRAFAMLGVSFLIVNWCSAILSMTTARNLAQHLGGWFGLADKHPSTLLYPMVALHAVLTALAVVVSYSFTLPYVETGSWGGLFLTFVIAISSSLFAFPIGILLALGRRSDMPVVRISCTTFIEVVRSMPLVTLLFMVIVLLPLFMPAGTQFNKLMQALIGLSLFTAVYLAEVVRSGMQAIPEGQYEAASALGFGYWRATYLVIMPQALKTMTPVLVTHFIGNLKDTTLVSIIGMYDLLGMLNVSGQNPEWNGLYQEPLLFGTVLFFVLCYFMSLYGRHLEKRGSGVSGGI
ncbi:amino acid ABC transporter permease [Mesorhizobium loti]|nr:amino acid ABC transporter permease [Mesorhizobium loti]PLP58023.1 amino acid ABC transporter permease [Mesorhizobium loti]